MLGGRAINLTGQRHEGRHRDGGDQAGLQTGQNIDCFQRDRIEAGFLVDINGSRIAGPGEQFGFLQIIGAQHRLFGKEAHPAGIGPKSTTNPFSSSRFSSIGCSFSPM